MPPGYSNEPTQPPAEVVWNRVARLAGGGMAIWDGPHRYIVVDPDLHGAQRRCVIEHERIHLQRGQPTDRPGSPPGWAAVVAREEHLVDQCVAKRLVCPTQLAELRRQAEASGPMTAAEVADHLEVTEEVARIAMRYLPDPGPDGHTS
jgi:hypothetical protein